MKKIVTVAFFILICSNLLLAQGTVLDTILNKISLDSLRLYVRQLSGDTSCIIGGSTYTIQSRHKLQLGNDKSAQYIYEKLSSFGLVTQYEAFSTTGANVIGTKVGTKFPNRYYVVCGHFDDMPTGAIAPGADDNASGTAAVIELARVLSNYNFQYTIKFIGFDEEEQGLVGSIYYATQAKTRGDTIMGVINLDMIAYDGNNDGKMNIHTKSVANSQEIGADIVQNNTAFNIGLNTVIVPSQPYSDHDSFLNKGYGAVLMIEDNNDFHPYYHTVNDKVQYFNWPFFYKMTKAAGVTLAKYALNLKIAIEHTPIASTTTETPIYSTAKIISGLTLASGTAAPRLYYRVNTGSGFGAFNYVTDIDGPVGDEYDFIIPPQFIGTTVEYYIAAQDQNASFVITLPAGGSGINPPGTNPPVQLYRFYVANQVASLRDNCNTLNNWTSASVWGITTSTFVSKPASITDSPTGNYANSTTNTLTSTNPVLVIAGLAANLQFYAKWDLESGYDYVQFQISSNAGTNWIPIAGKYTKLGSGSFQPAGQPLYNGIQSTWVLEDIDISSYMNKNILLRYVLKSDASINADGFYLDDVAITVYQAGGTIITTNFSTNQGWNLISVPVTTIDKLTSKLFPSAVSPAFSYQSQYILRDTLNVGSGYWLKFDNAQNNNFTGRTASSLAVPVTKGWNLIGSLNDNLPVNSITPQGIILSPFSGYNSGYYITDTLKKGNGYWVKISDDGVLNLNTSAVQRSDKIVFNKSDYKNKLTFIENSGKRMQLYLTESFDPKSFDELPPLPPPGLFDARFSSGKSVGLLTVENTVLLSSAEYPIQILFESEKNISLTLTSDYPDNKFTQVLSPSKAVYLTQPVDKIKIKSDLQPTEFALEQNYPNPFNPTTIIKYQLPEDSHVKLIVYDVLGREVTTLVNEVKQFGSYEVEFNATRFTSGYGSGVYFYQINAGNFVSAKKMLLVR